MDQKKHSIALTGFMATGKTTVGQLLAKKLGYEYLDTDEEIERRHNQTIQEIFLLRKEKYFRKVEEKVLKENIRKNNLVISCGGGIILSEANRLLLNTYAYTIWLFNSIETSVSRCKNSSRPLLNVKNQLSQAAELYESRKIFYARTSNHVVETEIKKPEEIANKIYEHLCKNHIVSADTSGGENMKVLQPSWSIHDAHELIFQ